MLKAKMFNSVYRTVHEYRAPCQRCDGGVMRLLSSHLIHHFIQVDNILREREESVDRQRRLAAKTARLRRSLR